MTEPIRVVDLADLVGRLEIAERAGVKLATVDTWRRRYGTTPPSGSAGSPPGRARLEDPFPEPIGTISGTPVWLWQEIERWLEAKPRTPGRPSRPTVQAPIAPLPDRLRRAIRANRDEESWIGPEQLPEKRSSGA
jgi:hypothetical protein